MADIQLKDLAAGKGKVLILGGPLTIEAASRLKEALLEAYESQNTLELDIRAVESMDLACVQVLCSAHRSFHQAGRDISLAAGISDGILSALKSMAIDAEACDLPYASACPWKKGDGHE